MTAPKRQAVEESKPNFWTTLPGILTGIAALVTAIAALIGGMVQAGFFQHRSTAAPATQSPGRTESPGSAGKDTNALGSNLRPTSDIPLSASTRAGEEEYKILSARFEDFGIDSATNTRNLLLRLRIRVTNLDRYPGIFTSGGFRLVIDDVVRSPKDSPSKTVENGASEDGEVTFIVPDTAKHLVLRVGYNDDARSDLPLNFH